MSAEGRKYDAADAVAQVMVAQPTTGAEIVQFLDEHGYGELATALLELADAHGTVLPMASVAPSCAVCREDEGVEIIRGVPLCEVCNGGPEARVLLRLPMPPTRGRS